jgi:glutamine amidotransferase
MQVAIIDYEMGNLFSVNHACEHVGLDPVITSDKSVIMRSAGLILPGVGAFGDAMHNLRRLGLVGPIKDFIASGRAFMGICLGLQLLLSGSEEFGSHEGLDIIKGRVRKFPAARADKGRIKVPQVGWNKIYPAGDGSSYRWTGSPLCNTGAGTFMYFIHSYYADPDDKDAVLSCTTYEETSYASSVLRENIFACQFHPEKSAKEGLQIYADWATQINNERKELYSG